jgi:hypothetical protein
MRFPSHGVISTYLAAVGISVPVLAYGFALREGNHPDAGESLIVGGAALIVVATVSTVAKILGAPSPPANPTSAPAEAPTATAQAVDGSLALATVGDANIVVAGIVHGSINYHAAGTTAIPKHQDIVDIDLNYLRSFYRDHTAIQAAKLAEAYIGTLVQASGSVWDVDGDAVGLRVYISAKTATDEEYTIILKFNPSFADRIAILRRGDWLSAIGRIEKVTAHWVLLTGCDPA